MHLRSPYFQTTPKGLPFFGCAFRYLIMVSKSVYPQVMDQSSIGEFFKERLMDCGFKSLKFSFTYSYTVLKLDYARLNACGWGLGTIKIRDLMASDNKWPNNVIPIAFEVDSKRICDVSCDLRRCAGATPLSHLSPLDLLPFATSLPFHLHQPLQSLGNSWRWWNPSLNGENGLQSMPKNLLY